MVGLTYGNGERENHVNGPKNRGRGGHKEEDKKVQRFLKAKKSRTMVGPPEFEHRNPAHEKHEPIFGRHRSRPAFF